jgi:hypothetical protein
MVGQSEQIVKKVLDMERYYELLTLENSPYSLMILSISYISPTKHLDYLEKDLAAQGFRGKVIFDFLLANGNNFNRFAEAYFNGSKFDLMSFSVVKPKTQIRQSSLNFYRKHPELLDQSVLSKPTKFLIRKNIFEKSA